MRPVLPLFFLVVTLMLPMSPGLASHAQTPTELWSLPQERGVWIHEYLTCVASRFLYEQAPLSNALLTCAGRPEARAPQAQEEKGHWVHQYLTGAGLPGPATQEEKGVWFHEYLTGAGLPGPATQEEKGVWFHDYLTGTLDRPR